MENTSAHLWKNWRKMLLKEEAIPSPATTAMTPQQPVQKVDQQQQKIAELKMKIEALNIKIADKIKSEKQQLFKLETDLNNLLKQSK